MIKIHDDILKDELAKILPLNRATSALIDGIADKRCHTIIRTV